MSSPESSHPCAQVSLTVKQCHSKHGIQDEDCVQEELEEKRCYSRLLCQKEATRFYDDAIIDGRASCSTLVELFAFPENDLLLPTGGVGKDQRNYCRRVVHALANCMSKQTVKKTYK
mmetsp:Transcript_19841/g.45060  ORF Transcript_19841/g.45060 Transcript_19841/m.45060 type:complete len:117 (-) Transcript_19841:2151-2501(-)